MTPQKDKDKSWRQPCAARRARQGLPRIVKRKKPAFRVQRVSPEKRQQIAGLTQTPEPVMRTCNEGGVSYILPFFQHATRPNSHKCQKKAATPDHDNAKRGAVKF